MRPSKREKGQVLLIGVISLLILIVAFFLLYDIQDVIRFKIKSQTGVDSAALVGAKWQMNTLNTIGELNLLKATSVLLDDSFFNDTTAVVTDEDRRLAAEMPNYDNIDLAQRYSSVRAISAALSQMQYRLLFIGPLIGFAAAQQAAKNNGVPGNRFMGDAMLEHIAMLNGGGAYSDVFSRYREDDFVNQHLIGFKWHVPYLAMLNTILDPSDGIAYGVAVLPNAKLLGTPTVYADPPSTPNVVRYLSSKLFYEAADANYWCWLKDFLDEMENVSGGKWWGNLKVNMDNNFRSESEFLSVGVEIRNSEKALYWKDLTEGGILENVLKKQDLNYKKFKEKGEAGFELDPLPVIQWAFYKNDDSAWIDYGDDTLSLWKNYLQHSFRTEAAYYSGAVSRMDVAISTDMLISKLGADNSSDGYLMDGLDRGGEIFSRSGTVRRSMSRHRSIQNTMRTSKAHIYANALAKPFGSIEINGSVLPPHYSRIVLPVFEKTAIIPISLEDPGRNLLADYDWYCFVLYFLPALGKVDSLSELPEELKNQFSHYYWLFVNKLDNQEWRSEGWLWLNEVRSYDTEETLPDGTKQIKTNYYKNRDNCRVSGGSSTNPIVLH